MAVISWIVGGVVGVAIAIGILSMILDSGSSRKPSSRNRSEEFARTSSSVSSTSLPGHLPNETATAAFGSRPGTTATSPKAPRADGRPVTAIESDRPPAAPAFGAKPKDAEADRPKNGSESIEAIAYPVREPAPSPEDRKSAEARLREVFREEFASATDEESKRELALDLLRREPELSDDKIALFASLKAAYDLAIDAADPVLARHAVDRMAERFEIDEVAVRSHLLFKTEEQVRADWWRIDSGCEALELGRACLEQGRMDEARRLSDLAVRQGEATKSAPLREAAAALQGALLGQSEASAALAEAKERYEANPGDADAAEQYGRLLCLERGDWEKGLPLLTESEDPQIRSAAELDLAAPSVPSEQVEVADAWWLVAERGEDSADFYTRARRWYEAASAGVTGLDKVHVGKRLEDLAAKVASSSPDPIAPVSVSAPIPASILQKNDLWDLTQGTDITARSAIAEGSDMRSAFGASLSKSPLAPLVKDGTLFDAAPGGAVHFVEWTTERHVKVGRIDIVMRRDVTSDSDGHAKTIRILAFNPFWNRYDTIVNVPADEGLLKSASRTQPGLKVNPSPQPALLSLSIEIEPVLSNRFRAEFVQAGSSTRPHIGPLLVELDAYPPARKHESPSTFGSDSGDGAAPENSRFSEGGDGGSWDGMIQQLRRDGLDIVIVFDSTSSMGGEIEQVKDQIARIGEALGELVPETRISICTYRDDSSRDAYAVKGLPLTSDFDEVRKYLSGIDANGGGDIPEAVEKGLQWAVESNSFRRDARKVILLFGDAPPHEEDRATAVSIASAFRVRQKGIVSTVTCRSESPLDEFMDIAQAGGGEAFLTSDERQIMTQLVILVFGSRHRDKVLESFELLGR